MAARKTTTKRKTTAKTAPKTAAKQEEKTGFSRTAWAVVYLMLGVLALLCLLPIDGFVLRHLGRFCRAVIGIGVYVLPFALFGLSFLLFTRQKGPVRLRGTAIALLPFVIGSLGHAITSGGEYKLLDMDVGTLLAGAMEGENGGFLSGGFYIILEWALSSFGAFLILLLLLVVCVFAALHITPASIAEVFRAPEYEYEDEEERERYEAPRKLPNVHVVQAARAEKRAEKKARVIDIPLDDLPDEPPAPKPKPMAPDEYVKMTREAPRDNLMDLVQDSVGVSEAPQSAAEQEPPQKKKADSLTATEQDAINAEIDENQKAPAPIYDYPPVTLLEQPRAVRNNGAQQELKESSECLIDTLESFGIEAQIVGIVRGPSVTRFELTIPRGIKISKVTALSDDIALSLGAVSVRIAPIPDKVAVGIEVPNKNVTTVYIRDCISSQAFIEAKSRIAFAVGKDITGASVIADIGKMPHLLIAGTTGSGKSVCINSMLISLLYKASPEEVRLIMIDPKMVELGNYNGIPHLLIPVVTDPKKAAGALNWAVGEMEQRYQRFADEGVRNLASYNDLMRVRRQEEEAKEEGDTDKFQVLPQIVIVIDELADLMMVAAKEVETAICRIAQKARAAGMHLIVATQRPSADVITGIMKANIPSRIAFAVASQVESRIILDQTGADKLIGKGDMLYAPLGEGKPVRVQGCLISSEEIEAVIGHIKSTSTADYKEEILEHIEQQSAGDSDGAGYTGDPAEEEDSMLEEAIDVIMDSKQASVSMLQRRLKLGYARAARIMDQMEERGIVGPFEGSKPRQVLISKEDWQEMKLRKHDAPF